MTAILNILTALLVGLAQLVSADVDFNLESFENLNVLQTIDIVHSYQRQTFDIQVENVGNEEASIYYFVVPDALSSKVALVEAKDLQGNALEVKKVGAHAVSGFDLYSITFEYPVKPQKKTQLGIMVAITRGTSPFPAEAKQSDSQWMLFQGTQNYVSIYKTRSQETQVNLVTDKYEVLKENGEVEKPPVDPTGFITFGPFKDVASLEVHPLALRFENPLPMSFVENLNRTVWVSHWGGSVSFDETYDIHNIGTKLKAPFSRSDFSKPKVGFSLNNAAVRALRVSLPEGHREEYYVDLVGNVSTSIVNGDKLELIPRYPIMGGWFYNFTVGWASDLANFVRSASPSNYVLGVPLIDGPELTAYGKVNTKIVLPEGASSIEVFSSADYDNLESTITYSYLDIYGRPTVVLEYSNIVSEQENDRIFVSYHYSLVSALRKPISYMVATTLVLLAAKLGAKLF